MDPFRRVLVPVDFSTCGTSALAFAGAIAALDADLTVLYVHPYAVVAGGDSLCPPPVAPLDRETRDQLLSKLEALSVPLRTGSRDVHVVLREGVPAAVIQECADRGRHDLIVMGTHGRRGLDRLLAGSVTRTVARYARCSVLAVRAFDASDTIALPTLSNFLCPVDLTPSSDQTLELAASAARRLGAQLTVMHVIDPWQWDDPWPIARGDEEQVRALLWESAEERLAKRVAPHADTLAGAGIRIAFGHPKEAILRVARGIGADLVVVGAHAQSVLEGFFFGSTAQALLSACPYPLLIARPTAPAAGGQDEETAYAVEV